MFSNLFCKKELINEVDVLFSCKSHDIDEYLHKTSIIGYKAAAYKSKDVVWCIDLKRESTRWIENKDQATVTLERITKKQLDKILELDFVVGTSEKVA